MSQNGGCFESPNYPNNYGNNMSCTIDITKEAYLVAFDFNVRYDDELRLHYFYSDGYSNSWYETYSGTYGPRGHWVGRSPSGYRQITWSSDGSQTESGFKICAVEEGADEDEIRPLSP